MSSATSDEGNLPPGPFRNPGVGRGDSWQCQDIPITPRSPEGSLSLPRGKGAGGLGSARYRTTQGVRALIAPLTRIDDAARDRALANLPTAAAAAFRTLPKADQQHALRVYHHFIACHEADTDLLAAALLHDIGKHPSVGITQRTARVFLARWPRALIWTATDGRLFPRWRSGMARLLNHAALGADLAASWGCTPETVAYIRASHDRDAPEIVRRLQAADDMS